MTVQEEDSAKYYGSQFDGILGTPSMMALMETTAQRSILKYLPKGFVTLGMEMNIKHIKATTIGKKIRCKSILKKINGREITFEASVSDNKGLIGTARIKQYIVESDRFNRYLKRL